jgi:hypothetical protein
MQLRRQSVLWQSDPGLTREKRGLKERRAPFAGDYFQKRTAYEYFKTGKSGLGGLVVLSTWLKSAEVKSHWPNFGWQLTPTTTRLPPLSGA